MGLDGVCYHVKCKPGAFSSAVLARHSSEDSWYMSLVVARRISDGLWLEIDAASSTIRGSASSSVVTYREGRFALLLVADAPKVLQYSTIEALILHPDGVGLDDPMRYIRKLKLAVDRSLAVATGEKGLVETVRSMGYRLAGNASEWEKTYPRSQKDLVSALAQIRTLVGECIMLMRATPLVKIEDGSLVLASSVNKMGVADMTRKYEAAILSLLRAIQSDPRFPAPEAYQAHLADIHSYFSFSRRGEVDEGTWRLLFERAPGKSRRVTERSQVRAARLARISTQEVRRNVQVSS